MAKRRRKEKVVLVDGPLDPGKAGKAKYRTAERDGAQVRLRMVDADSPNFIADFYASFAANTRMARLENSALPIDVGSIGHLDSRQRATLDKILKAMRGGTDSSDVD